MDDRIEQAQPQGANGSTMASAAPPPAPGTTTPSAAHWLWVLLGVVGGVIGFVQLKDRSRSMAWAILGTGVVLSAVAAIVSFALAVQTVNAAADFAAEAEDVYGDPYVSPPSDDPYVAEPTSTPVATAPIPGMKSAYTFSARATYTIDYATKDGYTSTAVFAVGAAGRYADLPIAPAADPSSYCSFSPETDALVPFALEVTNTTAGFDQQVRSTLYNGGRMGEIQVMRAYTDGGQCSPWGDETYSYGSSGLAPLALRSTDVLSQGGYVSLAGYFIVSGYFSPAAPNGDPSIIAGLVAEVHQLAMVGADSGPGAVAPVAKCTGPGTETKPAAGRISCVLPFGTQL